MSVLELTREEPSLLFAHYTPRVVFDLGYALYVLREKTFRKTEQYELCREIVNKFKRDLKLAAAGSVEERYGMRINAIAVSYSNSIWRLRLQQKRAYHSAEMTYSGFDRRMSSENTFSLLMSVGWRFAGVLVVSTTVVAFSKFLGPLVSSITLNEAGTTSNWLSGGLAGLAAFATGAWAIKRESVQRDVALKTLRASYADADVQYDKQRLIQFKIHWPELCDLYEKYTKEDYERATALEETIKQDLLTHERERRSIKQESSSEMEELFKRIWKRCRDRARKMLRLKKKKK